jgi:hypothetical protein
MRVRAEEKHSSGKKRLDWSDLEDLAGAGLLTNESKRYKQKMKTKAVRRRNVDRL